MARQADLGLQAGRDIRSFRGGLVSYTRCKQDVRGRTSYVSWSKSRNSCAALDQVSFGVMSE